MIKRINQLIDKWILPDNALRWNFYNPLTTTFSTVDWWTWLCYHNDAALERGVRAAFALFEDKNHDQTN
jgi:hypothetical protein